MFSSSSLALGTALLLISLQSISSEEPQVAALPPGLAAAEQLYRAGRFAEAEASYRALLEADPRMVLAQTGLVRAMLREQKIDAALDVANASLTAQPNSGALLAAKGDVHFRRAEMHDAEDSYFRAKEIDPREAHAYLGLARLYSSYSLYRKAYDELQIAHKIAPDDIDVQRAWLDMRPRKEQLAALEAYLGGPHPDDEEETEWLTEYLGLLKATADKPVHECNLVSKVDRTEDTLEEMYTDNLHGLRGVGLLVKLNERKVRLMLDTGAGGIIVGRKVAEKAGLTRLSALRFGGIGDKGPQSGYWAVADHIRIGELEFHDCVVTVSDKRSVGGEVGLIGADVLADYLIDLDLPAMRLKLAPLPKRPEDTVTPKSLNSEGEAQANTEQKGNTGIDQTRKEKSAASGATSPLPLPRDRYIAPEMANWTKVFCFSHQMLVPTRVNNSKTVLFALDTGSSRNILSLRAAQQIGKVRVLDGLRMSGVEGEVNKIYSSAPVDLLFGRLRQGNQDLFTLDLSRVSRGTGTEVSGLLGFSTLRFLEIKLDYRDGLVDFKYAPKR